MHKIFQCIKLLLHLRLLKTLSNLNSELKLENETVKRHLQGITQTAVKHACIDRIVLSQK